MAKAPKTMSSRLLSMKFMRRASASASPITPDEPSPKRQKLSPPASPASPSSNPQTSQAAKEVLDRLAAEAGETHWVLSFQEDRGETSNHKGLYVVGTSFAGLDDPKASELRCDEQDGQGWRSNSIVGRKSFGNFTRALKNTKEPPQDVPVPSVDKDSDSEDDDDSGNDHDEYYLPSPNNGKDMDNRAKARCRALKEEKLSGISSISGGGGQGETVKRKDAPCYSYGIPLDIVKFSKKNIQAK
ncbi:hypothetical protein FGG08_000088 [Glutinoglossum americanum]|uniref:Uncharacterized protein n=1 Tax=Glutinoglossum americanum TaxID=1670608 RepID=A0A9P8L740_9PEZI|nr:hypothetical protein FGG08_000088 [Glutinoglossum americanum]